MRIFQHLTDSPIRLSDGEKLIGVEIIRTGSSTGRFLFRPEWCPLVKVVGSNVLIEDCTFKFGHILVEGLT